MAKIVVHRPPRRPTAPPEERDLPPVIGSDGIPLDEDDEEGDDDDDECEF